MIKFIDHLEGLIVSKYTLGKALFSLFKLEARLAKLNIVPFLASIGALIALCFSGWLTLMVLIGYLIMLLTGPLLAIVITLFLNLIALWLTVKSLSSCIKQMSFEKTRALLSYQPGESHELTKTDTELH
ncbi:hypothetical protein [Legionella jordanis]|nr:hypothetical protein [Legionella jordanis]HAT8712701.1 hypothetical protein [Legionella jordanis]